jgi:magnesium chelatase accessory protein
MQVRGPVVSAPRSTGSASSAAALPAGASTLREQAPAGALQWERDGRDWPHREASRFVQTRRLRWHVQTMGRGPPLLLVHGTGAATHSWRGLAPLLAKRFMLVAPDLPGHGFTGMLPASGMSLTGVAAALDELLRVLDVQPRIAVGH